MSPVPHRRTIAVDLLVLDLETCGRCRRTASNLDEALRTVAGLLESAGTAVEVRNVVVDSAEKAAAERFVASPTIRVDGRDIALDFRESRCESEACACGDGNIDCRLWLYRGKEHTEAPVQMVVDAILAATRGGTGPVASPGPYRLPDNLRRFFESRSKGEAGAVALAACCAPEELSTCCEPSEKDSCCGPAAASGGACGCH